MREKRAALIIERFFITIKAEIDREVKQMEERKQKKRNRRNLMCETDCAAILSSPINPIPIPRPAKSPAYRNPALSSRILP
jgi:hypothetical protein